MKKAVYSYYAFQLFFNLLVWVPIFYEVQKKIGISDPEIFSIQSIYYLAFIFFELPTGFIADRFGYKNSLRMGSSLLIFANLYPIFFQSYQGFLVHFLLIAGSRSLISGAASAYLYEYLQSKKRESDYKTLEGRARSLGLIGKISCWSLVGYLVGIDLFLPYALTAVFAFVALLSIHYFEDLPPKSNGKNPGIMLSVFTDFKEVVSEIKSSRVIFLIMLQGVGIFVLVRINQVNLFQPVLGSKGFSVQTYGWIMAAMTFFEAFAASNVKLIKNKFQDHQSVFLTTLGISVMLILIGSLQGPVILAFYFIFSLFAGFAFPLQKQLLNDHILGKKRATILSMESILDRSFSALAVLPLGPYIEKELTSEILQVSGTFAIIYTIIIYLILAKRLK